MAGFLSTQLDFIFFFYGLAFIWMGATCFEIAQARERSHAWVTLGSFALLHGVGEWLDLAALAIADAPAFAWARVALMTLSFAFLMEFARLYGIRSGWRLPGRWIYILLFALVLVGGAAGGVSAASAVARYTLGFFGALATSVAFARSAQALSGHEKRLARAVSTGFAIYAVAAGVIVAPAPLWPATVVNQLWFVQLTGLPIQLVRGMIASYIAFSLWGIWGLKLIRSLSSERYARSMSRQLIWTLPALTTILFAGWLLTEALGEIYLQKLHAEAQGDSDLIATGLSGETATVEATARVLAGSPSIVAFMAGGGERDRIWAQQVLDLGVGASGAGLGYILDESGALAASFRPSGSSSPEPANDRASPQFQSAIAGRAGCRFVFNPTGAAGFEASYPVRSSAGKVFGVVVLQKSLAKFEADIMRFDMRYFFIDPDGVVALTNRPGMLHRALWPARAAEATPNPASSASLVKPLMDSEVEDGAWTTFKGEQVYVRRRPANGTGWSIVLMLEMSGMFTSRLLGIVVTFLGTMIFLIVFFGRERRTNDDVQAVRRIRLQELAQELESQANTDAVTGLNNRLRFNQAMAIEMLRTNRYNTPFCLVIFDVDHFKKVNDTFGHQIGDNVLVSLSRIVASHVRATDLPARWGGEEFVIMATGTDLPMAQQAAEKLRTAIARTSFDVVGKVTCSFGIAQYAEGDTAKTLFARADSALYQAKLNGRNRVELAPPPQGVEFEPLITERQT